MLKFNEQQQKEIETIKDRNITIKLSDADCERLAKKCCKHGLSIGQLLESFIGDLVDGTYTNGSDERMYANQWFERCGFTMYEEDTLLNQLINFDIDIEDFLVTCDEISYCFGCSSASRATIK